VLLQATFVEGLARQYNMEYFPRVWPEEHKDAKFSQDLARSWRLAESKKIIQSITEQTPDREVYMATAHHLEDQIETTLVRLIRGPHISNLQGVSDDVSHMQFDR
jgi:tRNA(Ile)-lysidine synthase TilS/MesJ